MLFRLGHDAFVGRDHEQRDVDTCRACEHVPHEAFVPGHVHHARADRVPQRKGCEPEIDGDASPLLLLPAVGIDPGEGLHEGRLPVVDVTGGPDYEAADGIGVGVGAGWAIHA